MTIKSRLDRIMDVACEAIAEPEWLFVKCNPLKWRFKTWWARLAQCVVMPVLFPMWIVVCALGMPVIMVSLFVVGVVSCLCALPMLLYFYIRYGHDHPPEKRD